MFVLKEYPIDEIRYVSKVDMIFLETDEKQSEIFLSNTSLGFLPRSPVSGGVVSEYILLPDNKNKYLTEIKAGDEVVCCDDKKIYSCKITRKELKENTKAMMLSVETGRKVGECWSQHYATFISSEGKIGRNSVTALRVGNLIDCYEDEKQQGSHFGTKFEETIIEK